MCIVPMKLVTRPKKDDLDRVAPYEALCATNRGFDEVLSSLRTLQQTGLFRGRLHRKFIQSCRVAVDETRAWVNFEITEVLNSRRTYPGNNPSLMASLRAMRYPDVSAPSIYPMKA
jgi:hypothetical protein